MGSAINFDFRRFETLSAEGRVENTTYGMVLYDSNGNNSYCNLFLSFKDMVETLADLGSVESTIKEYFGDTEWLSAWRDEPETFQGSVLDFFGEGEEDDEDDL